MDLASDPLHEDCPARSFIDDLRRAQPASYKSLSAVIQQHADHGPILNEQKSRELDDGIYEFKSRQGARILWFYEPGKVTILVHGFSKGAKLKPEVKRAKDLRDRGRSRLR